MSFDDLFNHAYNDPENFEQKIPPANKEIPPANKDILDVMVRFLKAAVVFNKYNLWDSRIMHIPEEIKTIDGLKRYVHLHTSSGEVCYLFNFTGDLVAIINTTDNCIAVEPAKEG